MRNELALTTLLALGAAGCSNRVEYNEYSGVMTEHATVTDTAYMPKNHGSSTSPHVGMDLDGNLHFGVSTTDVDIPEKFAVVFKCQHGMFVIDNNQEKARELYKRLHRDQEVVVSYREVFRIVGENGKTNRTLVKFDFIDAIAVEKAEN